MTLNLARVVDDFYIRDGYFEQELYCLLDFLFAGIPTHFENVLVPFRGQVTFF